MSPEFLDVDDVLEIHDLQIEHFGGSAGVRDLGLLASAVGQPSATFGGAFLHEDFFAMAAAYLVAIARNHPFVDGNKRTACVAALAFLDLNGVPLASDSDELYDVVMRVASGPWARRVRPLNHVAGLGAFGAVTVAGPARAAA